MENNNSIRVHSNPYSNWNTVEALKDVDNAVDVAHAFIDSAK